MVHIVEQTHEEKVAMYMKCTKKELIGMLIQANLHLENIQPGAVISDDFGFTPKARTRIK